MNLLKNAIISSCITTALFGCGTDKGLDYNIDASEAVEIESTPLTITTNETHDELDVNRYLSINLLQGVTSQGVSLSEDSTGVFIQDTVQTWKVSPVDKVLDFGNSQSPVVLNGSELIVDTYLFNEQINSGETAIYNLSYWINNGFEFTCANMEQHPVNCTDAEKLANPNRQRLTLQVNALPDPISSINLLDFNVPLDDTITAPLGILPSYTTRQDLSTDFTWAVPDNNGIATVDSSGTLTGLALGSTTLTVSSVEAPSLSTTVTITVTNPPKNVASIALKTPNGADVPSAVFVPTCTSYNFTVVPEKQETSEVLSGDFVYSYSSSETTPAVVFQADTNELNATNKQQPAYFTSSNIGSSENSVVSLNGSTHAIGLNIETINNIECAATLDSSTGLYMLNETFQLSNGRPVFKSLNEFVRNAEADDASVDTTGSFAVISGLDVGKQGSDAVQFTAAGTDIAVLTAWDKNVTRNIGHLSLKAGGNFKLSFWIKNNNATPFKIENSIATTTTTSFKPTAGTFDTVLLDQQAENAIEIPANADWQLIELDITDVPVLPTSQPVKWDMIFVPSTTDGSTPIDVYIDDVSIAQLSN